MKYNCKFCQDTGSIYVDRGDLEPEDFVYTHYDDGADVKCSCRYDEPCTTEGFCSQIDI